MQAINMQVLRSFAKSTRVRELRRKSRMNNRYSHEETQEEPIVSWFTSERSKILLQEMQRRRNIHRFSIKFNPKLMEEYCKLSEEYSRFRLHEFLGMRAIQVRDSKGQNEALAHLATIPEATWKVEKENPIPLKLSTVRYIPQMVLFLPKTISDPMRAGETLIEVIEDRKTDLTSTI